MSALVTVLTRTDGRPAGKTFAMSGGKVGKAVAGHAGRYDAATVTLDGSPTEILDGYRTLVESLTPAQSIILGHAPEAEGRPYRIVPQREIDAQGGRPVGLRVVDGVPTMARLKENFTPSRLLLLDFDPDPRAPEAWRDLDEGGRWALFTEACPEFAGAGRLTIPSGSGRVLLPDGTPAKSGPSGSHTYVVMGADLSSVALDGMRTALEVRLWARDLGFEAESKAGARLRRTLFDSSVWTAGREVFDGPPAVRAPLRLAPLSAELIPGGCAAPIVAPTQADGRRFTERTGATIRTGAQGAARAVIEARDLSLETEVVTERGTITVADFLASGDQKLRCQTPFRESSSWAGILRRVGNAAVLHDVGTGTTHRIAQAEAEAPEAEADQAPEPEHCHGDALPAALKADLAKLATCPAETAHQEARRIADAHAWRLPWQLSPETMADAIAAAHPAVERPRLARFLAWLERDERRKLNLAADIHPETFPGNVVYRAMASIEDAYKATLAPGIYLVRAAHGVGKTQRILRPHALESRAVVGIAPLVALVSELCRADRLHLSHYQTTPDVAPEALGICLNSIVVERHQAALNMAETVLVDEVAACVRAVHDRNNATFPDPHAVFTRLVELIDRADTAIGVDADLADDVIVLLADAMPHRTVTVLDVAAAPAGLSSTFTSRDQGKIEAINALAADLPTMIVADNATSDVAGFARTLQAQFPGKNIVDVHASGITPTTGTEEVKALLADLNARIHEVDCLLVSPAILSGISIETAHFKKHIALYSGIVAPDAFVQMMRRDRTAEHWTVGIAGGHGDRAQSIEEAVADLQATINATLRTTALKIAEPTGFDRAMLAQAVRQGQARECFARALWFRLEARGYTCTRAEQPSEADRKRAREIAADTRQRQKIAEGVAILAGEDKPEADLERLREIPQPPPEIAAMIVRADLRALLRLPLSEPILPWHVRLWQSGKLKKHDKLFRLLHRSRALANADTDQAEEKAGRALALRRFAGATGDAMAALMEAAGLDPVTLEGTVTRAAALAAWKALAGTEAARILRGARLATFTEREPARPLSWFGRIIKRIGLCLERDPNAPRRKGSGGSDGGIYRLARAAVIDKQGTIKTIGVDAMAAFAAGDSNGIKEAMATLKTALESPERDARLIGTLARLNREGQCSFIERCNALSAAWTREPEREPLAAAA